MGALDVGHIRNPKRRLLRTQPGDHRPGVEPSHQALDAFLGRGFGPAHLAGDIAPAGGTRLQHRLQGFAQPRQ